jgi:NAD(P)-dependent dehydrogenase (short-subunit alcohol dehydrogenase family)
VASLSGKVALVSGAGRGLGRIMALALAAEGADVALVARTRSQLEEVADEVRSTGGRALAVPTDVTEDSQVSDAVACALDEFGGLDILINNSGILRQGLVSEVGSEEWDHVFATNVRGAYLFCHHAAPHLQKSGGSVINIASNFALKGVPNHSAYCASKAAVVSLTKSLALEWARYGVRVNAIAPGFFATSLNEHTREDLGLTDRIVSGIAIGRMGDPAELAPVVVYLASNDAAYITGQTIVIDGGELVV